jgi:RHS repeat-associated protein
MSRFAWLRRLFTWQRPAHYRSRRRSYRVEPLEERLAPAWLGGTPIAYGELDGTAPAKLIAGAASGGITRVTVRDDGGAIRLSLLPFGPDFRGEARVAAGDLDGDGIDELIVAAGPGGGPHVRAIRADGSDRASFFAFTPAFTGGVSLAAADFYDDGTDDIVAGAGPGGGPHVRIFDGTTGSELFGTFAFAPSFTGGVTVAAGDVTGDGRPDLVVAAGPGGGPHVRVFNGVTFEVVTDLFVFAPSFTGGVAVAVGDVTGDATMEMHRLTSESIVDPLAGNRTIAMTYDAVGNRLTRGDSVAGTVTSTYDANDRLVQTVEPAGTTAFTHDGNGNLRTRTLGGRQTTYDWTAANELRRATTVDGATTSVAEFRYDARGLRVARTVDGVEARFLVDSRPGLSQVVEEYSPTGTLTTSFVPGLSQETGTTRVFFGREGGGNTRFLTDGTGARVGQFNYDAAGRLLSSNGTATELLSNGERRDAATGLDFLRARYYDANLGRFLSPDPFAGTRGQPQSLTDYVYANADPVNFSDPSGLVSLNEISLSTKISIGISVGLGITNVGLRADADFHANELTFTRFASLVAQEVVFGVGGGLLGLQLGKAFDIGGKILRSNFHKLLPNAARIPGFDKIVQIGASSAGAARAFTAMTYATAIKQGGAANVRMKLIKGIPAIITSDGARGVFSVTLIGTGLKGASLNTLARAAQSQLDDVLRGSLAFAGKGTVNAVTDAAGVGAARVSGYFGVALNSVAQFEKQVAMLLAAGGSAVAQIAGFGVLVGTGNE